VWAVLFSSSRHWFSKPNFCLQQLGLDYTKGFLFKINKSLVIYMVKHCANFHSKILKTHCIVWFQVKTSFFKGSLSLVAGLPISSTDILKAPFGLTIFWESKDFNCSLLLPYTLLFCHPMPDLSLTCSGLWPASVLRKQEAPVSPDFA